jgi:hypothetical protein
MKKAYLVRVILKKKITNHTIELRLDCIVNASSSENADKAARQYYKDNPPEGHEQFTIENIVVMPSIEGE